MAKNPRERDTTARDNAPAKPDLDTRVTLPINERGQLDLDRMHGKSKARVIEWFRDAELANKLGVQPPMPVSSAGPAASIDVVPVPIVHTLVDVIGQLSTAIIERVYGCTPAQAALMQFTPTERDALTPPLQGVLNKYGGPMLTKYGDELALAALLVTTITTKANAVQLAMRQPATVLQHPANIKSQEETV